MESSLPARLCGAARIKAALVVALVVSAVGAVAAPVSGAPVDSGFQIHPGFRIEAVASTPVVTAPVAMAFDEDGRLYVAEVPDFFEAGTRPRQGRIRLLEDTDGDGVYDTGTVFADKVAWPSSLLCYDGGLFVAATPEILYLKAAAGGLEAETRKIAFTGFGGGTNLPEAARLVGNLTWGPDNRVYGLAAGLGGAIISPDSSRVEFVNLDGADFSFDPRDLVIERAAGSARTGLTFDQHGRRYVGDRYHPLRLVAFEARYLGRNPYTPVPAPLVDLIEPRAPIFRAATKTELQRERQEILAAKLGSEDTTLLANGLVRARLTAARSTIIYRGSAFPKEYVGNVFVADAAAHVIHREVLREDGERISASRAADEAGTEFLIARDPAFQPTQILPGPDGALYVADWHGGNGGFIYRIAPDKMARARPMQLSKTNAVDLVRMLASLNAWHRETARRLLVERRDSRATALLTNMLTRARLPLARLEALRTLDGVGAANEPMLLAGLQDQDDQVRELALRLLEGRLANGTLPDWLWTPASALTSDASQRVRLQLACTLGFSTRPGRGGLLASILAQDLADPWMQSAVLGSAAHGGGDLLIALGRLGTARSPAGIEFMRRAGLMLGLQGLAEEIDPVQAFLAKGNLDLLSSLTILSGLGKGLYRAGVLLSLVDTRTPSGTLGDLAYGAALDDHTPLATRVEALRVLGVSRYLGSQAPGWLVPLLNFGNSEALSEAVIRLLVRSDSIDISTAILKQWNSLGAVRRRQAVEALLQDNARTESLVAALEKGWVGKGELTPTQVWFLQANSDPRIRNRCQLLFGPLQDRHPELVEQFKPSLRAEGSARRGRDLFQARCAGCHELRGEGGDFGPELDHASVWPRDKLLSAILEPNAAIPRGYAAQLIETRNHESFVGLGRGESAQTVTLRTADRRDSVYLRIPPPQAETWSLMPEGLANGLDVQGMADLLAYITEQL